MREPVGEPTTWPRPHVVMRSKRALEEEAGKSEHQTSFLSLPGRLQERHRDSTSSTQRKTMDKSNEYEVTDMTEDLDVLS